MTENSQLPEQLPLEPEPSSPENPEPFCPGDLASIQAGWKELEQGQLGDYDYEWAHQLLELLEEIWDPEYVPIMYSAPRVEWYIRMTKQFTTDIQRADRRLQGRILQAITHVSEDPVMAKGNTIKPLTGDLKGLWRCRVGDYRIVYLPDVTEKLITLVAFAGRGRVYES